MIVNIITKRLDALMGPVRSEIRLAQEQARERIQNVIAKAEEDVVEEGQFMSPDQRLNKAKTELEKAEEQLLSALGSMMKALWYISPMDHPFIRIKPIKDVKGRMLEKTQSKSA